MEAHPCRALVLRLVALGHELVPDAPRRAELGDLLEEVAVAVEEERQARREVVDPQTAGEGGFDVGHAVGDGEGELLDRGRAGLADVVATDRDRVPARQLARPELDRVGHQAHRRRGREQELLLGDELLEDVVLGGALEAVAGDAGLLGRNDVHRPDRRGRRVDGHRGRDALERQATQQDLHVREARDGDAARPELALRLGVIRVIAVERRHVVRDGQAGLTGREQLAEAGVRVLRRAEPGEHAHRPQPAAIAGRMDPAREGRLPGEADRVQRIGLGHGPRPVQRLDRHVADRREVAPFAPGCERAPGRGARPARHAGEPPGRPVDRSCTRL